MLTQTACQVGAALGLGDVQWSSGVMTVHPDASGCRLTAYLTPGARLDGSDTDRGPHDMRCSIFESCHGTSKYIWLLFADVRG